VHSVLEPLLVSVTASDMALDLPRQSCAACAGPAAYKPDRSGGPGKGVTMGSRLKEQGTSTTPGQ